MFTWFQFLKYLLSVLKLNRNSLYNLQCLHDLKAYFLLVTLTHHALIIQNFVAFSQTLPS
jgi:hypothetical protein